MHPTLEAPDVFNATLDELARGEAPLAEHKAHALFTAGGRPRELVILGAGALGQLILTSAVDAGTAVLAIADNNPGKWGSSLNGVPIMAPEDAVARFNDRATFVVGIFNGSAPRKQLEGLGCSRIASYHTFAWSYPETTTFIPRVSTPRAILKHREDLLRAYSLLGDRQSQEEFAGQIGWRCSLDERYLRPHADGRDTYFDPQVIALGSNEVVVDLGAFDGDTIQALLTKVTSFRKYYAFEPDQSNRAALQRFVSSLPEDLKSRVVVLPYAAGSEDENAGFDSGHGPGSSLKSGTAESVRSVRIDGISLDSPTLIKMDIEGSELAALSGAADTIRKSRPILALAAYHCAEHLWQLPMAIKSILPEYRVLLRRYAEECWETVYYAIPPGRARV